MGMEYQYAGSASYSRFDEELCEVVKILGGVITEEGFSFPKGTDSILVKWFNDVYGDYFTEQETKTIWDIISQYPEIKEVSREIWHELETLVQYDEAWYIT